MQRPQRIKVLEETITAFTTSKYVHSQTNKVVKLDAESIAAEIAKAKFYRDAANLDREIVPEKQEKPVIQVVDGDCLLEALELKKKGFNPLLLNMASATNVGGGYKRGAGAQEENLFRRTNLFQYHEPNKNNWYPIPTIGGLYCPNATVIRSSEQAQYEFLEFPETISFVAVAALRRPKLIRNPAGDFTLTHEAITLTRRKIQAILNIGLVNGHDAIVLSAFGCGAYGNPPSIVAQLFYEVISTGYAGGGMNLPKTYRHISFAIFDDINSNKGHNPEGNLLPFQNRFANGLDGTVDSISYVSQGDNESPEHISQKGRESSSFSNNDKIYNNNNNQRYQQSYDERGGRGRDRGSDRGSGRGSGRGRGRGRGRGGGGFGQGQMTLDAVWYKPSQDHIELLTRMGYSEKNAKRALYATKGNVEESVNWLKQNAEIVSISLTN